jgi:ATP-dependent phosphoenolpyruvate carboxykinase
LGEKQGAFLSKHIDKQKSQCYIVNIGHKTVVKTSN